MRIVSIVSGKGGVGKSVVASNLGAILSSRFKKNVVIVDCNVTTPHLGMMLGMESTPITLNHALRGEADINEALYNHSSGMWLVPASVPSNEIDGVDISLLSENVKRLYSKYVGKIDAVLLDCAPGLGRDAQAAIRASDEILFVTMPNTPAVMDVVRGIHIVREMGVRHVGVVVNMAGQKHELSPKEVERLTGLPVIATIPADKNVLKSIAMRMPVVVSHPRSKASKGLHALASSLLQQNIIRPDSREVG